MIHLAQHIEVLLLDNDCVIVPNLGGFVAHYAPAAKSEGRGLFLPPTRRIGFNPQLKINDGLLAQSYMTAYDTDFAHANKMMEREIAQLRKQLHEDGKAELPNIGELHYSIQGIYSFIPDNHRLVAPQLYGLSSFEMQEVSTLESELRKRQAVAVHTPATRRSRRAFRLRKSHLLNAAAMLVAIVSFFLLSTPVENTAVIESNYARILPEDLFAHFEKQSLALTPVAPHNHKATEAPQEKPQAQTRHTIVAKEIKVGASTTASATTTAKAEVPTQTKVRSEKPVAARPATTPARPTAAKQQPTATASAAKATQKRYHIIVASVSSEKDARAMAQRLKDKGYPEAQALIGGGKMRVSLQAFASSEEAYQAVGKLRQHKDYEQAWVLKQ